MGAALITIAAAFGPLMLLLAVPVRVAFRLEGIEAFNGQITVGWLFGWVRFHLHFPGKGKTPERMAAVPGAEARVKAKARGAHRGVLGMLRQAAFRKRVGRVVEDLVGAAHVHQLRLRTRLGLGDPADTGFLWVFVGPLNALAQNPQNADVQIEPEFMDTAFEFQASGQLQLIPLQVLLRLSVSRSRLHREAHGARSRAAMLDGDEHIDSVRAGAPIRVGSMAVLPIERVVMCSYFGNGRWLLSAIREPQALIVCDAAGIMAISIDAVPVSIEALRNRIPGLESALATL